MGLGPARRAWLLGMAGQSAWLGCPAARASAALSAVSPAPGGGGAPWVKPAALRFERDFGAHPDASIEWWYLTGALRTASSDRVAYGFQLTFFRARTPEADRQPPSANRLAPRHLLFAHAALTDVSAGQLWHAERLARWSGQAQDPSKTAPWAHASLEDTAVQIGNWRLKRGGAPQRSIYAAQWADRAAPVRLELQLLCTQDILLQGSQGYSRKSPKPGHASHYYSQPQMRALGRLALRGKSVEVEGRAWLDHEWSSALLDPEAVGWDWIGMNLDDGSALTVFQLRRADGSTLWAGGSWRPPGQPVRIFESGEVLMTPGRQWRSPATGARYPMEWRVRTPAGEHVVRAMVDAQELDNRRQTGTVYWEGISELLGPGQARLGLGYLEMTGYAGRLRL